MRTIIMSEHGTAPANATSMAFGASIVYIAYIYMYIATPCASALDRLAQSGDLVDMIMGHLPAPSIHLADVVSDLATAAKMPDWVSVEDIDVPLRQRPLSRKIDEASYRSLLSSAPDTRSRALALSSSIPHAGDWLNVVPSSALGLHLHDREFRLCVDYWLGLKMSDGESKCPLCAGESR